MSDRAEKAAKSSCSRWKKLCSAIQPVRHLSDRSYRLLLHFALFFHVQLLSWHLRTIAWNSHRNGANSQMSSLGRRQLPYLEMHHFWRLQSPPKKYKGRVSSWALHSLTEVHFSRQNVVLSPTTSAQTLLAEFQLLS